MLLQQITTNLSGAVRHDQLEGRDYLVVPMVMMTEGVHAGSGGPLYYPADELGKTPAVWNHKPIVIYHPTRNGQGISACEPEVLNTRKVGLILNTKYRKGRGKTPGKLTAEAWLEVSRLEAVDNRVLAALEADEITELSTGLYTDNEPSQGDWRGEKYDAIARNYRPDHLAILPDQVGACSVADGAGLLRTNAAQAAGIQTAVTAAVQAVLSNLTANSVSFGTIQSGLGQALRAKYGPVAPGMWDGWVEDVYEDFVVFQNKGKLWKLGYTAASDGKVELASVEPTEVRRVTEYRTVDGAYVGNRQAAAPTPEVLSMDRTKLIDGLIANGGWAADDREFLSGLSDARLALVGREPPAAPVGNAKPAQPATPAPAQAAAAPVTNAAPAAAPAQPAAPQTAEDYINNAPPGIREMLLDQQAAHAAKRAELTGQIVANKACPFTPEQLALKPTSELQQLANWAAASAPAQPGQVRQPVNYGGAAGGAIQNAAVTEEPLVAPVMNFGKAA